ncbi:armadillo-type protein [Scleroderma yunnanense]
MEYLRNLGSVAVSTLVQKSGINLPFTLGAKVASCETFWNLYDATKRDDGSPVSVFEYDLIHPLNKTTAPLARNALRKLRTIRHPDVLKFMDVVESDSTIFVMTEQVKPLQTALQAMPVRGRQEKEEWLLWGLHRVSVALSFINDSASSTHGNIRPNSIFITPSGEWKLGGFEVLSNPKDDLAVLYTMGGLLPDAMTCASPEVKKNGWSVLKDGPIHAADSYSLGILLHTVFNPVDPPPATVQPPHPPPQLSSRGSIPQSVFPSFKKLLNPNPKTRISPKTFLDVGMAETAGDGSGFFSNNRLVKVCGGLDNFSLNNEAEKVALLRILKDSASSFPPEFAAFRILPSLVSALEFGGASAATIVPLILQFGKSVPPDDYSHTVLMPLVKLYANPDRGTRMALLDSLPEYAEKLDKKIVADQVWPNLQTGFSDTVAIIREATVRAIGLLSPKLNDRILNNDLLRHLARLQNDPEDSIRTNTCILIGRLGPTLGYNTKRKVLVPAFSRALKDTFVHARVAGLMAFMATSECYDAEDVAGKVIPPVAQSTLDKEKLVRDQAFKAIELFVKKLEAHATAMSERVLAEGDGANIPVTMPGELTQTNIVNSATGAAGALASWAITSIGRKLVPSDLQSTIPGYAEPSTSSSGGGTTALVGTTSAITQEGPSEPKGMQLGKSKANINILATQIADETLIGGSLWGNDTSSDVFADGDWGAFESAPSIVGPKPIPATGSGLGFASSFASTDERSSIRSSWPSTNERKSTPKLGSRANTPHLEVHGQRIGGSMANVPAFSPSSSARPTPLSSPIPQLTEFEKERTVKLMSKEEKAAEMARRKEERRLRIEKLKEQKKNAAAAVE